MTTRRSKTKAIRPIARTTEGSRMPAEQASGWTAALLQPVDGASIALLRAALGAVLLVEMSRFLLGGWVQADFVNPVFHFTYHGFSWVKPLPGPLMYGLFFALAASAAMIAVGFWYRLACAVFCVGFSYVFLLEKSIYLNHFYFVCQLTFLMVFVPANRMWSLDARLNPAIRSDFVPAWSLWLLRFQVAVPYVFGGIAKLNGDWVYGQPMQMWMSRMTHVRQVVPLFGEHWLALVFSWCGLLLDLFVVPLLMWRKTRPYAFVAAFAFHLMNAVMFNIGIFPWMMIFATTLFFEPDWPRRLLARLGQQRLLHTNNAATTTTAGIAMDRPLGGTIGAAVLIAFMVFQLVMPWRHFFYPGQVDWTEEGSRFAWRMMLNDKAAAVQFLAFNPRTKEVQPIEIRPYLSARQLKKMSHDPEMVREFANFLSRGINSAGGDPIEVRVIDFCALNGRRPQLLVDPGRDLGTTARAWGPANWVEPLTQPLPKEAFADSPETWQFELGPVRERATR
jgi:vitamin K-dependent gamma-carboxylase